MEMMPMKPERKAQLEAYAQKQGKSAADALDDIIAQYLEWDEQDYQETVAAVKAAFEDVKAGRTKPAEEVHEAMRLKYGFPR